MAAHLNVETGDMAQVVQYADDSVEAWFTDGARMTLSACGAAFTRQEEPEKTRQEGAPSPPSTMHQFTAYAVRGCRERVRQLVAFRNLFAERPFLCPSLLTEDEKILASEKVLRYAAWPSSLELATSSCLVQVSSTGNIRLTASDGSAWAELGSHGQTLTTGYLAGLPRCAGRGEGEGQGDEVRSLEDGVTALTLSGNEAHQYVWTRAVHSVAAAPECWQQPLSILLQYRARLSQPSTPGVLVEAEAEKENGRSDAVVSSTLPQPLPLTCHNSHLHHSQAGSRLPVKVMLTEGILYRVLSGRSMPFVEALPNQNTVLRSHDPRGRFFECWCVEKCVVGEVRHSLYCVDHPPASSDLPYSMARVLGQASRFLSQALKQRRTHIPLCWKDPSPTPSPPSSPIHHSLPGLGRFTARANGHVRCVFADRTIIDFYRPQTQNSSATATHKLSDINSDILSNLASGGQGSASQGGARGVEVARGVWIGKQLCRVMQPNGRYVMVSTQHPSTLHRYVEVVRQWCEWLELPEEERGQFCQGTVYDQHSQRQVLAELSKIERFDAILSGRPAPPSSSSSSSSCVAAESKRGCGLEGCGQDMPQFVRDALQRTTDVVQGIDTILRK